eukprot:Skav202313  [mRNA]  locus=scaffold60:170094:177493:+ [translate_table: standard]
MPRCSGLAAASGRYTASGIRRASRWAGTWREESEADMASRDYGWREGIKEWGAWFVQYSAQLGHGGALRANLVDFAENQLTSAGAATLHLGARRWLKTFAACGIAVHVGPPRVGVGCTDGGLRGWIEPLLRC